MASIKFKTYGKAKKNASIHIRYSGGRGIGFEVKSGITIPNTDFFKDGKTRKVAAFTTQLSVQSMLDNLMAHVSSRLHTVSHVDKGWLTSVVNEFHGIKPATENGTPSLIALFEEYIEHIEMTADHLRAPGTVKTYNTTVARLKAFQGHIQKEYKIDEVDLSFTQEFKKWARAIARYGDASINKSLRQIKTVCRYASKRNLPVSKEILNETIKAPRKSKEELELKPIYLTEGEIQKLMEFSGPNYLQNARDWLVISCWTGCRVSDLMGLSSQNIITTVDGHKAIKYTQQKTNDTVLTPYHPHVEEIIQRNGEFPKPISDQRYNEYIKELCQRIGLGELVKGSKQDRITKRKVTGMFPKYELVTSHIGRRSFATNLYGKMDSHLIMLVTGHDTIKQFMDYIGASPESHISIINNYYKKEREQILADTSERLKISKAV